MSIRDNNSRWEIEPDFYQMADAELAEQSGNAEPQSPERLGNMILEVSEQHDTFMTDHWPYLQRPLPPRIAAMNPSEVIPKMLEASQAQQELEDELDELGRQVTRNDGLTWEQALDQAYLKRQGAEEAEPAVPLSREELKERLGLENGIPPEKAAVPALAQPEPAPTVYIKRRRGMLGLVASSANQPSPDPDPEPDTPTSA